MGSHESSKGHLVSAIIFGLILVTAVYAIFSFLAASYSVYVPMLALYAVWVVVSLVMYGRGLDRESAEH